MSKNGDGAVMVGLWWSGKGPFAEAIKYCTNGPWSHCALVVNGVMFEAAAGKGVVAVTDEREVVARIESSDLAGTVFDATGTGARDACAWLWQQVGKPYDGTALVRYALRLRWPRKASGEGSWFCSELVYAALVVARFRMLADDLPAERVDPFLLSCSPTWVFRPATA